MVNNETKITTGTTRATYNALIQNFDVRAM